MTDDVLARLRAIAAKANEYPETMGVWFKPQDLMGQHQGPMLVEDAAHIATFSPSTVLALLDLAELYKREFDLMCGEYRTYYRDGLLEDERVLLEKIREGK